MAAFTHTHTTENPANFFAGTRAMTALPPAAERIYNVLFLCSGNDERSLIAEALLNFVGGGKFWAYSAGPAPAVEADPRAIDVLREARIPCGGLWPKSWDRFLKAKAPRMDLVVSLCPYVPYSVIPSFPGNPGRCFLAGQGAELSRPPGRRSSRGVQPDAARDRRQGHPP